MKYVMEGRGLYNFFKNHFVAQGTVELNISWPSNFFKKDSWPLQLILVLHLSLDYRNVLSWVVFKEIFKALKR